MKMKDNSKTKVILGKNVRYYRHMNNLTQEKLAERCDLSTRYISDIENGNGNISVDTLAKISTMLNVNAFQLIKEKNIKELPKRINMK